MESRNEAKPDDIPPIRWPLERVKQFEIRQDDLFLLTYPKSGTHWLMEIIPLVLNGRDTEAAIPLEKKGLLLEMVLAKDGDDPRVLFLKKNHGIPDDFDVSQIESPRFLASHIKYDNLPKQLFEKKTKVIYLARNPKDVAVSLLNQIARPPINAPDDLSLFLTTSFFTDKDKGGSGEWGVHVSKWWKQKDEDHVLFLKYEDLRKDMKTGIQAIAKFLGKDLSFETVTKIADHCTIDNMKEISKDDPVLKAMGWKDNPFVRKGKVGGWKERFTVAQSEMMDKYCEKWLTGTGLEFDLQ
ncbi:sulfotransferase 1B1-like [Ptychodera flava]|uniref:sulfotransferase 1B1-like n=1 Tax=Ptychodera flava TaxID=63121 RepID=UPI00396AB127